MKKLSPYRLHSITETPETNFKDVLPSYLRPNVLESVVPRKKEDAIAQAPDGTLFYTQDEVDNWRSAQRKYKGK